MDAEHFDRLVRTLQRAPTRRGVVFGAGSGLLATIAGLYFDHVAGAKRRKKRRMKKRRGNDTQPPPPPECLDSQVLCGQTCVRGVCCPNQACEAANCTCKVSTDGETVCLQNNILLECVQCPQQGCPSGSRCIPLACGQNVTAVCATSCTS